MKHAEDIQDQLLHELALEAMEHGTSTEEDDRWAQGLVQQTHERLAAMRRDLLDEAPAPSPAPTIRLSVMAMTRDALHSRIHEILAMPGAAQVAYRDLTHHTDHDLRVLVSALEETISRGS